MSKMTPMLSQYLEIKARYPDCILFFRIGDFYEMFFEDAVDAAGILEITLTKKHLGSEIPPAPLCGVPFHAADSYLARLLAAGRKVAVCDQVEDPGLAVKLVRREVTRVITPGTATADLMLSPGKSNFLASVFRTPKGAGLAWADVSTGECEAMQILSADSLARRDALLTELVRIDPSEVIVGWCDPSDPDGSSVPDNVRDLIGRETGAMVSARSLEEYAVPDTAAETEDFADCAVNGLLAYVRYAVKGEAPVFGDFRIHRVSDRMVLDKTALRNLELTETMFDRETSGSLLGVMDRTRTAMGARLLKKWIREPLIRREDIDARLDAVEYLLDQVMARNDIRDALRSVHDMERLAGRVAAGTANGRNLQSLRQSLEASPGIRACLAEADAGVCAKIAAEIDEQPELCARIDAALLDEQPLSTREGGLIRTGFSAELDEMKAGITDGQQWIAGLEKTERERTGIKNLKVRYNRVQGYYIEISNANLHLSPEDYIRKQTLANAERFVTPELKKMERAVLSAEAQINSLEQEIFRRLREEVYARLDGIRRTAAALAQLDVLCSLAETAQENGYARPEVEDSHRLFIVGGRHPVIERMLSRKRGGGAFVRNDVSMNLADESMLLITGPNMAGKSTFMRQTALIILMAQMGSFVPADEAVIGICDRIFTRIGASDNLAREQSTFLVEMNELSTIIEEYTDRSFLILDEIGRGTSTYDGLAIAWAALDYLCAEGRRARCMFATHYHELTALEGRLAGLKNLHTEVDDSGSGIVYLHKIAAGASSRSYGIHVAEMAGLPADILRDAEEKLAALESEAKEIRIVAPETGTGQISMFAEFAVAQPTRGGCSEVGRMRNGGKHAGADRAGDASGACADLDGELARALKDVDVFELTPSAAIALVEKLKKMAAGCP